MLQLQTYDLYLRVSHSPLAARQRALKSEILTTKSEFLKTSGQDQFAKWAKLRRSVDKGLADLECCDPFDAPWQRTLSWVIISFLFLSLPLHMFAFIHGFFIIHTYIYHNVAYTHLSLFYIDWGEPLSYLWHRHLANSYLVYSVWSYLGTHFRTSAKREVACM